MLSVSLGPLALPVAPLVLLASAAVAQWAAGRMARRRGDGIEAEQRSRDALTQALVLGLVAARLAHGVQFAQAYRESPWALLDVRDGGWQASVGLAVAALWLLVRALREVPLRWPLAFGGLVGAAAWTAGALSVAWLTPGGVPAMTLTQMEDGRPVPLAEAVQGPLTVVSLWASWCGPCRAELPVLASAQRREAGRVRFLFVNQGESSATVRTYLAGQGLTLDNVLLDEHSQLGPALGSAGLPTVVYFDAHGRRLAAHMGALSEAGLRAQLLALGPRTP